jgi:hypothetical protein
MSGPDEPLAAHWQFYEDRARQAHLGPTDDYGQGREELLNDTLTFIQTGAPFTDEVRDRLDRVPQNRSKKHLRLRLHLFATTQLTCLDGPHDENARLIDQVHEALLPGEWDVECRLAYGESYADVAGDSGVTEGALKMRVSRWRARVREAVAV